MKYLTKIVAAGLAIVYLSGCGGSTPNPSDVPSWYLKVPQSNPTYYYGAGSGSTKEDAKAKALSNIAGLISSTVSASMEISTKDSTEDGFKEVSKSNIKSTTDAIRFSGITVTANEVIDGKVYANVKVDRAILFASQKKILDNEYNEVIALLKRIKTKGSFAILKNAPRVQKSVNNMLKKPMLPILKSINPAFNSSSYRDKIMDVVDDLEDAKRAIVITLKSKDSLSNLYKEIVAKYISSANITIVGSASKAANRANLLVIEVSVEAKSKVVKSRDPRLRGASFADMKVTLTTKDHKGRAVARNIVNVVNISKEGLAAAKIKTKKFEKVIRKKGIFKVLQK